MSLSEKVTKAPAGDGSKKPAAAAANAVVEDTNLDLLEEDDEFEEFPAESPSTRLPAVPVAIASTAQQSEICVSILQNVCRTLARKQNSRGSQCDSSATSPAVLCCAVPVPVLFLLRSAWTGVDEDAEDVQLWGDNWDDDDAHYDDFANQLREELKKGAQKAAGEGTVAQRERVERR